MGSLADRKELYGITDWEPPFVMGQESSVLVCYCVRRATLIIQRAYRRRHARRSQAAVVIQAATRSFLASSRHRRMRRSAVIVQVFTVSCSHLLPAVWHDSNASFSFRLLWLLCDGRAAQQAQV